MIPPTSPTTPSSQTLSAVFLNTNDDILDHDLPIPSPSLSPFNDKSFLPLSSVLLDSNSGHIDAPNDHFTRISHANRSGRRTTVVDFKKMGVSLFTFTIEEFLQHKPNLMTENQRKRQAVKRRKA